ncbi:hypothetical protein MTBUT4_480014 [Magnetospirillum sp. UT-4]|nr:hypothetical protein MTBUT4_480014 [Magnetospirillum sp. UT-4]
MRRSARIRNGGLYRGFGGGTGGLRRRVRHRRGDGVQGHRRGGVQFQFPAPDRPRRLHPHPLRDPHQGRGSAFLPGADGASGRARPGLPDSGAWPRRPGPAPIVRAAGGGGELPQGHERAPPDAGPLRRAGAGHGRDAPGRGRFRAAAGQRFVGFRLAPPVRGRARPRRRGHPRPGRLHRCRAGRAGAGMADGAAPGADPRRPVSRQRLLPGRPRHAGGEGVGHHRLLLRLHRLPRLRHRHLPERLVLRARPVVQRHQGPADAERLPQGPPALARGAGGAAAAGPGGGHALPADPALRLAEHPRRRLRQPQGPDGILPQAQVPPGPDRPRRLRHRMRHLLSFGPHPEEPPQAASRRIRPVARRLWPASPFETLPMGAPQGEAADTGDGNWP